MEGEKTKFAGENTQFNVLRNYSPEEKKALEEKYEKAREELASRLKENEERDAKPKEAHDNQEKFYQLKSIKRIHCETIDNVKYIVFIGDDIWYKVPYNPRVYDQIVVRAFDLNQEFEETEKTCGKSNQ